MSSDDRGAASVASVRALAIMSRLRDLATGSLTRNGYSLIANVAVTSVLGFVFWLLAARLYSAEVVGRNAALMSAMTTICVISQLNLASALNRFLPVLGRQQMSGWIARAYGVSAAVTIVAAAGFVAGVGYFVPSLAYVVEGSAFVLWFIAACVFLNLLALQEGTLAGLRSATWVPLQNTGAGIGKIVLLLAFAAAFAGIAPGDFGPFIAWTVPVAAAFLLVNIFIFGSLLGSRNSIDGKAPDLPTIARYLGGDYIGQVFLTTMFGVSSLLVVHFVGAAANAVFYVALTMAYALYLVGKSMTVSLVAEGAAGDRSLAGLASRALGHSLAVVSLGAFLLVVAAPFILALYGPAYAAEGVLLLRLLVLSAVPFAFTTIALGVARVQGRMAFVAIVQCCMMVLVLGMAVPLVHWYGSPGVAIAWLVGQLAVAPVATAISIYHLGWSNVMAHLVTSAADEHRAPARPVRQESVLPETRVIPSSTATATGYVVLAAAMAIWASALQYIEPTAMTDLGLASTMRPAAWLPFVLLSFGFFICLDRAQSGALPLFYVACLIVVLHVTPVLEYGTLRYPWGWKHIGLVDYFQRHGALDPVSPFLGAYHNWPGFFAAVAMAADLLGVRDVAAVAIWWPPALAALWTGALAGILRQVTADRRIVYAALWMFVAGNWIGQDYFSPQSVAYLFYLGLLGVCIALIRVTPKLAPPEVMGPGPAPRSHLAGLAQPFLDYFPGKAQVNADDNRSTAIAAVIAFILIAAMIPTHQFTPIVVIVFLAMLVAIRLVGPGLLLFSIICFGFWTMYAAWPYMEANLAAEVRDAGTFVHFTSNLVDTSSVSLGQATVSWASRGVTLAICLAAAIGLARRLLLGNRDLFAIVALAAPVPIGLATSYGGEVVFRVFLFALPGLAFFAAAAFFPTPDRGRAFPARFIAALFGLALAVGFVFANNGKDRQYVASRDEISTVEWLYTTAPPNTLLIEGAAVYPRQMRNYENFLYVSLADEPWESAERVLADPANTLAWWLENEELAAGYVVITRSQKAYVDAMRPLPKGALDSIEQALLKSPRFLLVRSSESAKIFALNRSLDAMGGWVQP